MKKLLFAVVALSVLAPLSGIAEPTHPNEIGLYTTPDGYGATGTDEIGAPVNVYLVLTKPEVNNVPLSGVVGFDCQLNFNPVGGIFMTANVLNGNGLNIGDVNNIWNGYLEFIVGFGAEVPSINDTVLLVSLQFINTNLVPVEVTMGLITSAPPSIPGHMSFVTPSFTLEVMYSMGGSHDAPVFIFNGEAIPVENQSFGSVKALYR